MLPPGEGRIAQVRLRLAGSTWETVPTAASWLAQYAALQHGLPRIDFKAMSVVSFSNYVLGFGHVQSDLNLRTATSIATTLDFLSPSRAQVRAADAVVQTCRGGAAWNLDGVQLAQLRQWLAFGLAPPDQGPVIHREAVPARVLVVMPGPRRYAGAYVAEVRRRLRLSARRARRGAPARGAGLEPGHRENGRSRALLAPARRARRAAGRASGGRRCGRRRRTPRSGDAAAWGAAAGGAQQPVAARDRGRPCDSATVSPTPGVQASPTPVATTSPASPAAATVAVGRRSSPGRCRSRLSAQLSCHKGRPGPPRRRA